LTHTSTLSYLMNAAIFTTKPLAGNCTYIFTLARPNTGKSTRPTLKVKSYEEIVDTIGVDNLLERDRKEVTLAEGAFDDGNDLATAPIQQPSKAGKQRKRAQALRDDSTKSDTPKRCRDAIEAGIAKMQAKDYQGALDLFQLSLELPGAGVMRMASSPKEYSCPSEGEENAALFNMACAWSQLGENASAMTCVEALLDNDFDDFNALRYDPDLSSLQGPQLEKLINESTTTTNPIFGIFGGGKKKESGANNNKPWLQW
jgi:hypothetical protein